MKIELRLYRESDGPEFPSGSKSPTPATPDSGRYFNKTTKMYMKKETAKGLKGFKKWLAGTEIQKYNDDLWFDGITNDSYDDSQIAKMYLESKSQPTPEKDAIAFAEWATDNYFSRVAFHRKPRQLEWRKDDGPWISTSQLYELFKQDKS